jgi:hypothetical protein
MLSNATALLEPTRRATKAPCMPARLIANVGYVVWLASNSPLYFYAREGRADCITLPLTLVCHVRDASL